MSNSREQNIPVTYDELSDRPARRQNTEQASIQPQYESLYRNLSSLLSSPSFRQPTWQPPSQSSSAQFSNFTGQPYQPRLSGQTYVMPTINYQPVQSAGGFRFLDTYKFDPATDPSRLVAARATAREEAAKAAEETNKSKGWINQSTGYGGADSGNARGGGINGDKRIRNALLTAKKHWRGKHYADGGMPQEDDDSVQRALEMTKAAAPAPVLDPIAGAMQTAQSVTAPGRRRFEIAPARIAPTTISDRPRDLPEEGGVTIKRLTDSFKKAIDNHLALPPAEQIANARQAENNVAKYVGRGKTGKINSVLTANKKLMKAQTAGEDDSPLTLPDGRTLEMTGLSLMPDYREGQFKMCGNSGVCRDLCLGKEAGQYRYDQTATQAQMPTTKEQMQEASGKPRMAALRRTMAMMRDPESFAVYLHELIDGAKIQAERRGSHLGVRLNVLSDLSPKIMEPIIKAHPDVSFYDYTKMNYDPVAPNHHYTYSSTGLSQPERGVENPFSNWRKMRDRLDQGHNVAMAFAHGKGDAFPEVVHDEETGKRYRVVSGDEHDFRPLDMVPEGESGTIIALKNMAASNSDYKYENAARNSHGFFVHHDPAFVKTAKGTFAVDENGKRISQNRVYTVPVQPTKRGTAA